MASPAPTTHRTDRPVEGVLLRRALTANLVLSSGTGVTALVAAPLLDDVMGLPAPVLAGLGLGLLGFAGLLRRALSTPTRMQRQTPAIIAADVLWVLLSPALPLWDVLSPTGESALVTVTAAVAGIAAAQAIGLRRTRRATGQQR